MCSALPWIKEVIGRREVTIFPPLMEPTELQMPSTEIPTKMTTQPTTTSRTTTHKTTVPTSTFIGSILTTSTSVPDSTPAPVPTTTKQKSSSPTSVSTSDSTPATNSGPGNWSTPSNNGCQEKATVEIFTLILMTFAIYRTI